MKIGVIGDTHIPELSPELPARIRQVFQGLDIILHLGDAAELWVLRDLQEQFTLTFAVSGERDTEALRSYVEERRVVEFGRRRIAMIHGHQYAAQLAGWREGLRRLLGRPPDYTALPEFLVQQFEDVDAIVFGHTHEPYVRTHGGVLLFNPGAAAPTPGHRPSVGILDMGQRNIAGRIVYL